MPDQVNLGALIALLRRELDQINHAILVLERMALGNRARTRTRVRRDFRVRVNKKWTKDNGRKD
jgi:hypothetical protein